MTEPVWIDIGCFERGCACASSNAQAGEDDECVVVVKRKDWVGLSEKEMYKLWLTVDEETDRMAFGKAVEAKLKEKNYG